MIKYRLRVLSILIICAMPFPAFPRTPAVVHHVTDGDTISLVIRGKKSPVRLIGIDAPESSANRKARRDSRRRGEDLKRIISMGKRASRFVRGLLKKGDRVILEFDVQERDRYGRVLAYVYLGDGRMLNDVIIRSGYAYTLTIPPNVRHRDRFARSYRHARNNRVGLWGD